MSNYYKIKVYKIVDRLVRENQLWAMFTPFTLSDNEHIDRELKKDMIQEIIIMILEYKDPKKLIKIYNRKELGFFVLRMIGNQIYMPRTLFDRKYNKWEKNRSTYEGNRKLLRRKLCEDKSGIYTVGQKRY